MSKKILILILAAGFSLQADLNINNVPQVEGLLSDKVYSLASDLPMAAKQKFVLAIKGEEGMPAVGGVCPAAVELMPSPAVVIDDSALLDAHAQIDALKLELERLVMARNAAVEVNVNLEKFVAEAAEGKDELKRQISKLQIEVSSLRAELSKVDSGSDLPMLVLDEKVASLLSDLDEEVQKKYKEIPGLISKINKVAAIGAEITKHQLIETAAEFDFKVASAVGEGMDDDIDLEEGYVVPSYEELEEKYAAFAEIDEKYKQAFRDYEKIRQDVAKDGAMTGRFAPTIDKRYLIKKAKNALKVANSDNVKDLLVRIGKMLDRSNKNGIYKTIISVDKMYKKLHYDLFIRAATNVLYFEKLSKYLDTSTGSGALNNNPELVAWLRAVLTDTQGVLRSNATNAAIRFFYNKEGKLDYLPSMREFASNDRVSICAEREPEDKYKVKLKRLWDGDRCPEEDVVVDISSWVHKAFAMETPDSKNPTKLKPTKFSKALKKFLSDALKKKENFKS